jgi:thiopeptide-type bacteriocin biosynthesis protein
MKTNANGFSRHKGSPCRGTWLSAYLYYAEPWEEFLLEGVEPFVRTILEEGLAEQFFFIRYWEKGPHIRLRIKGESTLLQAEVKPRLETYFRRYFKEKPSQREDPEQPNSLPEKLRWVPNHTIRYVPYQPEIKRYGGPAGILVAEEQFQASSRAVLSIIEASKGWDYERALGAAIQLHLGFVSALGMKLTESIRFFSDIFSIWLTRSYHNGEDVSGEELQKRKHDTLKAYEKIFRQQEAILIPFHQRLWNAAAQNAEFEEQWLNRWLSDMAGIGERLKNANIPRNRRQLWPILESLVHMTNNRLGILNQDEAFLGYLIKESLEAVGQSVGRSVGQSVS